MGGQQSTRKLTIDNDDPTNVIKVSEAVVERLRGKTEAVRNRLEAGTSVVPVPVTTSPVQLPVSHHHVPVYPQYMLEPSQTSLQLRQENEANLRKNDAYWQSRINELEERHSKIDKIMEIEYESAVKEVNDHFKTLTYGNNQPACQECKKAVMECYKKYPNEPIRCACEVQAFAKCVDKHRSVLVDNNAKRG